jgi:hypothetical protein
LAALPAAVEQARKHWRASQFSDKRLSVFTAAARAAIHDDILTAEEEEHVNAVGRALGIDKWIKRTSLTNPEPTDVLRVMDPPLWEELIIARLNDGWLPEMSASNVTPILDQGEVPHAEFEVALMKEVTVREFRGNSGGISVPLGFGIRYSVGAMRGRSVVVSQTLQEADRGALTITSKRTLFTGEREIRGFDHAALVAVRQYKDGLRLGVSNRRETSLFKHRGAN